MKKTYFLPNELKKELRKIWGIPIFGSKEKALMKIREWDYSSGEKSKIPIGIFYQIEKPTFEELTLKLNWQ